MNRNTGILGAIVLAVAAIFSFILSPSAKESAPGTATKEPPSAAAPPLQSLIPACAEIQKRIADFVTDNTVEPPTSCKEDPQQSGPKLSGHHLLEPSTVHYIIATLPDPMHTHFPLLFDRLTEALQQGAQDQGYNYDDSWLPWSDQTHSYDRLEDQQKAGALSDAKEKQPGVLVFRKALSSSDIEKCGKAGPTTLPCLLPYSEGLVVFVVGENPTGGINLEQFNNAVAWVRKLSATADPKVPLDIKILGPYFSGSFPSLAQALLAGKLVYSKQASAQGSTGTTQNSSSKAAASAAESQESTVPSKKKKAESVAKKTPTPGLKAENPTPTAAPSQNDQASGEPKSLTIYSGSVTSETAMRWFTTFLGNSANRTFYSFQENDDLMIDRYCQYLTSLSYDTGKLAILSEDETAYGGGQADPSNPSASKSPNCINQAEHGPLYLYYPRDIASLRSAYEQESSSNSGSSRNQSRDLLSGLPLTLAEPSSRQHDTIRTYGGSETPLSQEATLWGMMSLFSAHDIQFILLRSSNTLDQIFLTRLLSKAYPQGRIILTSADLLFRRSSETAGFRGTMTLTTYPLFTWQQDWTHWQTPESRHSHRAFPEDTAEGLYLATRFLIDGEPYASGTCTPGLGKDQYQQQQPVKVTCLQLANNSVVIQDYAPPSWLPLSDSPAKGITRPPTWLSVVGDERLWPVAVFQAPLEHAKDPPEGTLPWVRTDAELKAPDLPLELPIRLILLICILWGGWHLFCCTFGSREPSSVRLAAARYLGNFAPMRRPRYGTLMFVGGLALALVATILASFTEVFGFDFGWHEGLAVAFVVCFLGLCSIGGVLSSYRRRRNLGRPPSFLGARNRRRRRALRTSWGWRETGPFVFIAGLSSLVFYTAIQYPLSAVNRVPAYWRSINPLSGVSPIMPMLLLAAGLYGWFWFTLSGLALFNNDRPRLPRYPKTSPYPSILSKKIGFDIESVAIPLDRFYGLKLLLSVILLMLSSAVIFAGVRSLGRIQYAYTFSVLLSICIGLILLDGWQLLCIWGRLRQLLNGLDQLPLRRTLRALKDFSWGTVWKMGGHVVDQRNRLVTRELESLQHLRNQLKGFIPSAPLQRMEFRNLDNSFSRCCDSGAEYVWRFAKLVQAPPRSKPYGDAYEMNFTRLRTLQLRFSVTAGLVLKTILFAEWQQEKHSLIQEPAKAPIQKGAADQSAALDDARKQQTPGETGDATMELGSSCVPPEYVTTAEEFFVLPCLGFIQNILGRIRTMTIGMLVLFVAAALSVASYPFDPRPELSGLFLCVFAISGAIIVFVYAQMHRDATLSNITNTDAGKLGSEFWTKIIALGAGPVLALLAALFPQIATFITSWLQPGVQAIK
ncbi:MAG: phage holin family protein [Candidatus Korobacteraceae bacterium]